MNTTGGMCECGCGEPAPIAKSPDNRRGAKAGQPVRFIVGHSRRRPIKERLLSRVTIDSNGCWIWGGVVNGNGYGYIGVDGYRRDSVHRVAYREYVGPIPEGLELDHLCRVRLCCNPEHLEPVTRAENQRRGYWSQRTHCSNGHEYTPENTRWYRGHRSCRSCPREFQRRLRSRKESAA